MIATSLFVLFILTLGLTVGFAPGRATEDPPASTVTVLSTYRGVPAAVWARRFRHRTWQLIRERARSHGLKRTMLARPSVREAIELAAATYGNRSTLWSIARCESHLSPWAHNASGASGLMQFLPSTFASTPYGRMSIWSAYANAMAGGWMISHGRRSEWVC